MVYHGSSKKARATALRRVRRRGGVLLTTYGTVTANTKALGAWLPSDDADEPPPAGSTRSATWDYVVLDEGHKVRHDSLLQ